MKKYYVPATEVVALVNGSFICAGSPGGDTPTQTPANPYDYPTGGGVEP